MEPVAPGKCTRCTPGTPRHGGGAGPDQHVCRRDAGSLWAGLSDLAGQIDQLQGADAIWLESATSAEQALEAVKTAVARTSLPVAITCAMTAAPLQALRDAGAAAAGYNCTPWPADAAGADILKPDSAGLEPNEWAAKVPKARLRGGCCGTDARYLGELRATSR